MEITLEKIELVKDRTGVSYKEAKEALEANNGSVVDAIIAIEDEVNGQINGGNSAKKADLVAKLKEVVSKGNATKIVVKKDDDTIMNLPLSAGIVGTVVAPWGVVAGLVAAFGFKCKIEVLKDDGSTIDISDKADELYDKGVGYYDKAGEMFDDAKVKGNEYFEGIKDKAPAVAEVYTGIKDFASDMKEKILDRKADVEVKWDEVKDAVVEEGEDLADKASDLKDEAVDKVKDLKEEATDKAKEVKKDAEKKADEAKDVASKKADEAKEAVEKNVDKAKGVAADKIRDLNEKLEKIEKKLDK